MSFWQPRSLQQLIVVSVFAALVPLGLAIVFTVQTLDALAEKNREVAHAVVDATRLGQEVQNDALELERRARQLLALGDPEIAGLYERERELLSEKLISLQEAMPTRSPDIHGLLGSLERLTQRTAEDELTDGSRQQGERLDHSFSVIAEQAAGVATWLQSSVDQRLRGNAREARSLIDNLQLQFLLLACSTLALLLALAHWINKPVRDLTKEIQQLGTSGLSHAIDIKGPLELQALGTELERLRKGLHESEQQQEQFLRHISHELKTPLSSLREGADLLADQVGGRLSQQQQEIVEIVRQNGIELQRLIENLLDYNRMPAQSHKIEELDLEALWLEILENYSFTLNKKALRIHRDVHVKSWVADRDKLKTALDNLLSNAIHYTPEEGDIKIVCRASDGSLVVDVANSGDPIPKEDAERVFEPFFQSVAKRSGPIKGSGIGLTVARECIEAQGGALSLIDHTDLPICFRLTCPAH